MKSKIENGALHQKKARGLMLRLLEIYVPQKRDDIKIYTLGGCFKQVSSLGDVIAALGSKSKHVPYRNSKVQIHRFDFTLIPIFS